MNTTAWIAQGILAAFFIGSGAIKLIMSRENLLKSQPWVSRMKPGTIKFIGLSEFLGGAGLVLPGIFGVMPVLTPLAASGLLSIMYLAAIEHLNHGEFKFIPVNAALGLIALFIAGSRF